VIPNEYSYRDPRLSLWQTAAHEVAQKHALKSGVAPVTSTAKSSAENPFMVPAHVVGHSLLVAGKPFEWLGSELEKGFLDLKAKFDPLEDCAKSAALFLKAELEGNVADSKTYAGQLRDGVCNAIGWGECVTAYLGYKALLENPVYRANENTVVEIKPNVKIGIIGDWGTGDDIAINVLQQLAALKPDILIHLGDVYFAGTQTEAQKNFLDICNKVLPGVPLYSLCGNHDMYSGGGGYYWLLDQIGQKASYFSLQNDDWIFQAMDTGYHDNNPFNVATNMTSLFSANGWSEADWHMNKIKQAGKRKVVLLSHHQLFSPFGSVGTVDKAAYAYNPNLYQVFEPVLPKVEWWFWGHEHTLGVFPPYMGLYRGRCVGASAVPVYEDQQSYTTQSGLTTLNGQDMPAWAPDCELETSENMYNNCFAFMTLNGPSATVEYYEVEPMQPARRYQAVDRV
jgi:hypothetical protein